MILEQGTNQLGSILCRIAAWKPRYTDLHPTFPFNSKINPIVSSAIQRPCEMRSGMFRVAWLKTFPYSINTQLHSGQLWRMHPGVLLSGIKPQPPMIMMTHTHTHKLSQKNTIQSAAMKKPQECQNWNSQRASSFHWSGLFNLQIVIPLECRRLRGGNPIVWYPQKTPIQIQMSNFNGCSS